MLFAKHPIDHGILGLMDAGLFSSLLSSIFQRRGRKHDPWHSCASGKDLYRALLSDLVFISNSELEVGTVPVSLMKVWLV